MYIVDNIYISVTIFLMIYHTSYVLLFFLIVLFISYQANEISILTMMRDSVKSITICETLNQNLYLNQRIPENEKLLHLKHQNACYIIASYIYSTIIYMLILLFLYLFYAYIFKFLYLFYISYIFILNFLHICFIVFCNFCMYLYKIYFIISLNKFYLFSPNNKVTLHQY